MPLDPSRFLGRRYPDREFSYTERDTMLYALSVGMAQDPTDRRELAFVCGPEPRVLPSQATVIAWDYSFIEGSGIDEVMILHGAQSVEIHNPLPPAATIVSEFRISDLFDKGPGKGAVIVAEIRIREKHSGTPLCTNLWTSYARGEGGFGGEKGPSAPKANYPDRTPDAMIDTPTNRNQPLFYRLLGDVNPHHFDPDFARAAGFERPILHGNCTFGIACRSVVIATCNYRPERLSRISCQFSAPGLPGDTVRTEIWREGGNVIFRAFSLESGAELIGNGLASIDDAAA